MMSRTNIYDKRAMLYDPSGPDGERVSYVLHRPADLTGKHYGFEFTTHGIICPGFDRPLASTTSVTTTSLYWLRHMKGLHCIARPLLSDKLQRFEYKLSSPLWVGNVYHFNLDSF